MARSYSRRRRRERGAVAVEFGLTVFWLVFTLSGGLALGYALVQRHNLAEAVSYATRAQAVASMGNPQSVQAGAVRSTIEQRLGQGCRLANVTADVKPFPTFKGGNALYVTASCQPLYDAFKWFEWAVPTIEVKSAMPL
jgi:Flp pilus assembly protein TadG